MFAKPLITMRGDEAVGAVTDPAGEELENPGEGPEAAKQGGDFQSSVAFAERAFRRQKEDAVR